MWESVVSYSCLIWGSFSSGNVRKKLSKTEVLNVVRRHTAVAYSLFMLTAVVTDTCCIIKIWFTILASCSLVVVFQGEGRDSKSSIYLIHQGLLCSLSKKHKWRGRGWQETWFLWTHSSLSVPPLVKPH